MKPYDYAQRSGIRPITWDEFASLSRTLAEKLEPFKPQVIMGIARAGLFPATAVACSLRCELFPIRLTRRVNDEVVHKAPVWKVAVPDEVNGEIVAVVDEIADTGQTLRLAAESAMQKGAVKVITACLVSHSWADPAPHVSGLISDAFIIFPWDAQILRDGMWINHPEVEAGMNAQPGTLKK